MSVDPSLGSLFVGTVVRDLCNINDGLGKRLYSTFRGWLLDNESGAYQSVFFKDLSELGMTD